MKNKQSIQEGDAAPAPKLTKGERTRRRLTASTRRALEKNGYAALRVSDIAKGAKVAIGTFYLYFQNKEEATLAVMEEFMAASEQRLRAARTRDDPFLEVLEPTVAYARLVFEESALLRAFVQFSHHHRRAARMWSEVTNGWLARVEAVMDRRLGKGRTDAATRTMVTYAMSWMVDGVLLSFLTRDFPRLQEVLKSPEQLGETLSVLWYRAVYGEDPDASQLKSGRKVLEFHLQERIERTGERQTPEEAPAE